MCKSNLRRNAKPWTQKHSYGVSVTDILPKLFPDTEEPKDAFERFTFKEEAQMFMGLAERRTLLPKMVLAIC